MLQASSWLDRSACSPAPWEELLSVREQFDILLSIILGHGGIIWQDSVAAVGKPEQSYTTWFLRKVTSRTTKEPPTTPTTNIKFAILIWNNRSLIRLYPSGLVLSPHIPSHIIYTAKYRKHPVQRAVFQVRPPPSKNRSVMIIAV